MEETKVIQPEVVVRRVVNLDSVKVEPEKPKKLEAKVLEVTIISHINDRYLVFGEGPNITIPDGDTVFEDGVTEKGAKTRLRAFFGKDSRIESWPAIVKAVNAGAKVKLYVTDDGLIRIKV